MSNGLTLTDRLLLLWARDLTITLTEAGQLDVQGPSTVLRAALPMLRMHKTEFVRELRRIQETMS